MENKKVDFKQVAKIDMERYFGKGKKSLLDRQEDINTLLLQLTIIVNEHSNFYNRLMKIPYFIEKMEEKVKEKINV